jgi:sarcosine oxidase, subunit beta
LTGSTRATRCDVAVVGGGITGCATAFYLATAGARVTLLERGEIGTEASGRNAGSLHGQIQYEPFATLGEDWARAFLPALDFLLKALPLWRSLPEELGADLEVKTRGGLLLIDNEAQLRVVERKVAMERELGVDARLLGRAEVRELAPWVAESIIGAGYSPVEGKANPMLAAPAFARGAEAAGAEIRARTTVHGIEPVPGGVRLTWSGGALTAESGRALTAESGGELTAESGGELTADQVVLASGTELAAQAGRLGVYLPISAEPVQVGVTEPVEPLIDHLVYYAGGRLTLKQAQAGSLLIGGGWPARIEPGTGYPLVNLASLRANLAIAVKVAPVIGRALLLRSWAGVGHGTPDHRPVIGPLPGVPRVLAGLFPAMGLTAGPLMGQVLADLALGRTPEIDLSPFRPTRFATIGQERVGLPLREELTASAGGQHHTKR